MWGNDAACVDAAPQSAESDFGLERCESGEAAHCPVHVDDQLLLVQADDPLFHDVTDGLGREREVEVDEQLVVGSEGVVDQHLAVVSELKLPHAIRPLRLPPADDQAA